MFVDGFASAGKILNNLVKENIVEDTFAHTSQAFYKFIEQNEKGKLNAIEMELGDLQGNVQLSTTPHKNEIVRICGHLLSKAQQLMSTSRRDSEFIDGEIDLLVGQYKEFTHEQSKKLQHETVPFADRFHNVSKVLNVIESSPSIYHLYRMNRDWLVAMGAANADDQVLQKLRKLDAKIYTDLMPPFSVLYIYLASTCNQ